MIGAVLLAGCGGGGGGTGPTGPPGGNGAFSATINGSAWVADANLIQTPNPQKQGHYALYGARLVGATTHGITLNLFGITGPGAYPLGTGGGVSGGIASLNEASAVWQTPVSGDAGSITITALTATRIAGTFQFTADPVSGGSGGARTVAGGQFDLPLNRPATLPPMAESDTGSMTATIGGAAWRGASGGGGAPAGGVLFVIFTGTTRTVAVTISPYNGPGAYTLGTPNTFHRITVNAGTVPGSPRCWGGASQFLNGQLVLLDTGTITITSATASRVRGTFSGTLAPAPTGNATGNLSIAGGSFSYGFP